MMTKMREIRIAASSDDDCITITDQTSTVEVFIGFPPQLRTAVLPLATARILAVELMQMTDKMMSERPDLEPGGIGWLQYTPRS